MLCSGLLFGSLMGPCCQRGPAPVSCISNDPTYVENVHLQLIIGLSAAAVQFIVARLGNGWMKWCEK